jgi:hypothetical protein
LGHHRGIADLLLANAMLIGHGGWKLFLLSNIVDPEQRRMAIYAPLRELVVGIWGMACGLIVGIASLQARELKWRQPGGAVAATVNRKPPPQQGDDR